MGRQELANEVVARRVEMGYATREAYIEDSGLSARTIGDIEAARRDSYRASTLARLDAEMEWSPGRSLTILRAGQPAAALAGPDGLTPIPREVAQLLDVLDDLDESDRANVLRHVDGLVQIASSLAVRQRRGRPHPADGEPDSNAATLIGQQSRKRMPQIARKRPPVG